ncbi:lipoprotein [Gammaproteobacteria bacterium]|nr:lipoprotein [Gammaproteobacteria bacterium]
MIQEIQKIQRFNIKINFKNKLKLILIKLALIILTSILMTSCTHTNPQLKPQSWLKPGVSVNLPAPNLMQNIQQQQLLSARTQDNKFSLLTILTVDEKGLTLIGLSPLGVRLFKIEYLLQHIDGNKYINQNKISIEQNIAMPNNVPPANQILSDIMLSYWPINAWRTQLPKNWHLVDLNNQRILYDSQGEEIIKISYNTNKKGQRQPINLNNYAFSYYIDILNIDQDNGSRQ